MDRSRKMEMVNQEHRSLELLEAQAHIWNQLFNFINSMSLKCATELGIPEIIHKLGRPITLLELVDALPDVHHRSKADCVYRLMRVLTHSGFFALEKINLSDEEGYSLTPASRLLVEDHPSSMKPFVLSMLVSTMTDPWHHLSRWFRNMDDETTFYTFNGTSFWEYKEQDPVLSECFDEGMAKDTTIVADVISRDCRQVFEGLETLVDVGGGTGTLAKAIADAFPQIQCTVLDLAPVVAGLEGTRNLKYIEGNMFDCIPPTDAVLLKWILHGWSHDESIRILNKCKEAITSYKGKRGKVIIIEMVVDDQKSDHKSVETQLFFDMMMMTVTRGRERKEKEWAKLFSDAGFSNYKIYPVLGLRSVIEVYP